MRTCLVLVQVAACACSLYKLRLRGSDYRPINLLPSPPLLAGRAERDRGWRCKANEKEALGGDSWRWLRFRQVASASACCRGWWAGWGPSSEASPPVPPSSKATLLERSSKASTGGRGGRRAEARHGARRRGRLATPYAPAPLPPPSQPKRHDTEEGRYGSTGADEGAAATCRAPTTTTRSKRKRRRRRRSRGACGSVLE